MARKKSSNPWWIRKFTTYKCDACKLGEMIKEVYGVEFNIPYMIMEDQRQYDINIYAEEMDPTLKAEFQKLGEEMPDVRDHFESVLNDLCFHGHLDAGDYTLEFDD